MAGTPQPKYSVCILIPDKTNPTQSIPHNVIYSPYKKHRNGQKPKSQWNDKVTMNIEKDLFHYSMTNGWYDTETIIVQNKKHKVLKSPEGRAWGFWPDQNNKRRVLGYLNTNNNEFDDLHFCVFEEGNPNLWHGYPANFKFKQDRPTDIIFQIWRNKGFLTKAKMQKIKSGLVCTV